LALLDRYLAREILLPFGAGLLFLTQILLAQQLLAQSDVLIGSGVSALDVLLVAVYIAPHFLGFIVPVAFLLGAVLGVGRLAEDREVVALSAAGISPARLAKVPAILGLGVCALALWLAIAAEPWGMRHVRLHVNEVIQKNLAGDVRAGVFYDEIPGFTLYAEKVRGRSFEHVLLDDRTQENAPLLAVARGGTLTPLAAGGAMQLVLDAGEIHRAEGKSGPAGKGDYAIAAFRSASVDVGIQDTVGAKNRFAERRWELTPAEIAAEADALEPAKPEEARRMRAWLHRKLAGPAAVIAFGLLAAPIAAARRFRRAFGYAATLGTVVGYYSLLRLCEGLTQRGAMPPWLGPQVPNVVFALVGLAAIWMLHRRGAGAVR
jgi:lipopolysaccharide export system permease protein